jgi:cation diffusion facilitator CzcD-associated flavoprotein CzcO
MPARPPPDAPEIAIVGAGMSGLLMGMRLRAAGLAHFTIWEKAQRVGGTWRDNTYPGLVCDVPAALYSYAGRPNPGWTHRFARGPQIQDYLERTARDAGLLGAIRFGEEVTEAAFRDGRWHLATARGTRAVADVLVTATGFLRRPRWPAIAGLERFAGPVFHSAQWDHAVALDGRRVGLVGTGSSGVQIAPAIVDRVGSLAVFQRTPQWLLPFPDRAFSAAQMARRRRLPVLDRIAYRGFGLAFEHGFARAVVGNRPLQAMLAALCRLNLRLGVADPALRARLTPAYRAGCKRLMFSSAFYPAIQRPNAALVDAAIARVVPQGVETADGRLHPLDVLILATGYHAHDYMRPMAVAGADGATLAAAWKDGPEAYLTVAMPGFPNLFMLIGPRSPVGNFSLIAIAEAQADYIVQLVRQVAAGGARDGRPVALQPTRAATDRFNAAIRRAAGRTVWMSGCQSWYLGSDGLPDVWPWTMGRFRRAMRRPVMADFERAPP